jgi:hypothetical protein
MKKTIIIAILGIVLSTLTITAIQRHIQAAEQQLKLERKDAYIAGCRRAAKDVIALLGINADDDNLKQICTEIAEGEGY